MIEKKSGQELRPPSAVRGRLLRACVSLSLRLDPALIDFLNRRSDRTRVPRTAIIEEALEFWARTQGWKRKRTRTPGGKPALGADLASLRENTTITE